MRAVVGVVTTVAALVVGAGFGGRDGAGLRAWSLLTEPSSRADKADIAAPTPEMQSMIKALTGRWSTTQRLEAAPGASPFAEQHGEEVWQAAAGGTVLLQDERLVLPSGEEHLLGIIWWDSKTKDFHGMECNTQNPHTCDLLGSMKDITIHWDGTQLLIEELEGPRDGRRTMYHETISAITDTSFTQTGDSGPIGGPYARVFTIHATRVH